MYEEIYPEIQAAIEAEKRRIGGTWIVPTLKAEVYGGVVRFVEDCLITENVRIRLMIVGGEGELPVHTHARMREKFRALKMAHRSNIILHTSLNTHVRLAEGSRFVANPGMPHGFSCGNGQALLKIGILHFDPQDIAMVRRYAQPEREDAQFGPRGFAA